MLKAYFSNFVLRFSTSGFTAGWNPAGTRYRNRCSISQILFVLAMQIILNAAENADDGLDLRVGCSMPPMKAFMYNTTVLTSDVEAVWTMMACLDKMVDWSRMSFKTKKSRSLSNKAGKVFLVTFEAAGQQIPTLLEELIKSLGKVYDSSLKDREAIRQTVAFSKEGLLKINRCRLLGKSVYASIQAPMDNC
jgi:hypothetical protein